MTPKVVTRVEPYSHPRTRDGYVAQAKEIQHRVQGWFRRDKEVFTTHFLVGTRCPPDQDPPIEGDVCVTVRVLDATQEQQVTEILHQQAESVDALVAYSVMQEDPYAIMQMYELSHPVVITTWRSSYLTHKIVGWSQISRTSA